MPTEMASEEHRDPACTRHLHCACGLLIEDDDSNTQTCPECGGAIEFATVVRDRAGATS